RISYQYRSDNYDGSIIKDFYLPVLSRSKCYKRAVGYFSSHSLVIAAKGIVELISNGGNLQLIASPQLNSDDIEAITKGYDARENIIEKALLRNLNNINDELAIDRLNYLAWLIANNQLDIKIAVLRNSVLKGIFHEKVGIMEDFEGNTIAFTGSSNETEGGLYNNFESIDVFCSWIQSERMRVDKKLENFNKLWNDDTHNVEIISFPTALKERLLSFKQSTYKNPEPIVQTSRVKSMPDKLIEPELPNQLNVRDYQKKAIQNWFRNECQGLLEMATGTGKTITAITGITKLYEVTKRLAVIIVCPYTHLVDQWVKDLKLFNMSPIIAYHSRSLWENELNNNVSSFQAKVINHFCVVTTNATFSTENMQQIIKKLGDDTVIVADEAHHFGAANLRQCLPNNIPYRLALSATPNRWFDEEGTSVLLKYFGNKIVYKFGLDKAVGTYLTEYYYYPQIVYLDEDESDYYYEVTRKISKLYNRKNDNEDNESNIETLLIERSRILSRARNKLVRLKELFVDMKDTNYNIVYCGDSSVDGEKQIDSVVSILGEQLEMRVHTFTSREDDQDRQMLLKRFQSGELQALVAIKCLDEGVDVPATQRAFILASSTNPREFIQRRGRVLRKYPGKRYSYIYDFIVVPRNLDEIQLIEPSLFNTERNLVKREMNRVIEFADLAVNGPLAHEELNKIKNAYNLLNY
ncbi:DEAD/DEAH box helicase family protein, partial [Bacillus sp. JJ1566]|uniref:DEAD/DEAH box helicase family protein n=1 Tax=Bacillus sp. JJ1566 TaxID=3122961 RepID=UPI002FFE55AC